jgi:uncharacterized protein YggE
MALPLETARYQKMKPRPRLALIPTLVAAGFACAAAVAAPMSPPPPHERPRSVSVGGEAEVSVKPDRARLRLGVTQLDTELRKAETEVNRVVKAYVAEARSLGVAEAQIATTGISIQPEYVWDEPTRNNRLAGYRVSRDIELQVRDLDKLGSLVLAATQSGVNQVQSPQLESSKADELQRQALTQAAKNAQAKAKLLADTLGVKLGAIRSLSENVQGGPVPMPKVMLMRSAAADSGNAEMGLQTGEIRYSASVSAEFDLIQP